jgi:hypothetical protein
MFSVANFGRTDMRIPRSLYERDAISSPTQWGRIKVGGSPRLDALSFLPHGPHLTSPTSWGRNHCGEQ